MFGDISPKLPGLYNGRNFTLSTKALSSTAVVLTSSSNYFQLFTGTSPNQTVTMPVVSTLQVGQSWLIVNVGTSSSSALVIVNSSGGNAIVRLGPYAAALVTCTSLTGTTAASWNCCLLPIGNASGTNINIGDSSKATGGGAIAIGSSTAVGNCIAIGANSNAEVSAGIAIGSGNTSTAQAGVAIGQNNTSNGENSLVLGYAGTATNQGSFVYSDSNASGNTDSAANQYVITAAGGYYYYQSTTLMLQIDTSGNVRVKNAGSGLCVAEGSNAKQGTATLSAGSVVVSNTSVTANSRIFLTIQSPSGTIGSVYVSARTAGTSFTISSTSVIDTSVVAYQIFEPA